MQKLLQIQTYIYNINIASHILEYCIFNIRNTFRALNGLSFQYRKIQLSLQHHKIVLSSWYRKIALSCSVGKRTTMSARPNALRIKYDRLVSASSTDASNRCIVHARVKLLERYDVERYSKNLEYFS